MRRKRDPGRWSVDAAHAFEEWTFGPELRDETLGGIGPGPDSPAVIYMRSSRESSRKTAEVLRARGEDLSSVRVVEWPGEIADIERTIKPFIGYQRRFSFRAGQVNRWFALEPDKPPVVELSPAAAEDAPAFAASLINPTLVVVGFLALPSLQWSLDREAET